MPPQKKIEICILNTSISCHIRHNNTTTKKIKHNSYLMNGFTMSRVTAYKLLNHFICSDRYIAVILRRPVLTRFNLLIDHVIGSRQNHNQSMDVGKIVIVCLSKEYVNHPY